MTRLLILAALVLTLVTDAAAARPWAWLGVRIRDLSEQEMDDISRAHGIREGFGVFIVDVMAETPAARAGLKSGDVVVAFEDRPVTETRLLQRLIATAAPETEVRLVVLRREGRRSVPVRLGSMPRDVAGDRVAALFGFFLREPASADAAPLAGTPLIAAVERRSVAERAGLKQGDVLLQVNDRPVLTRDGAREALADAGPARSLRLVVRRDHEQVPVTLDPAQ
ncbi:MAG: PDZ domain-containing protein [Candidatus Rokubacteria bacterium]|nr:PDZ domain-containing protein [Candidatus Rokubacteria bacterium]